MMPNAAPLKGSRPRVSVKFRDPLTNLAVDPSSLFFKVQDSEGYETVYEYLVDVELVRDLAGDYHIDVPVTLPDRLMAGKYLCRWEAFDAAGLEFAAAEVVLEVNTRYVVRT